MPTRVQFRRCLAPLLVVALVACIPATADDRSGLAKGAEIAGFEGDVYSALNLQGADAQSFGQFLSSALYGLALADAYVKLGEGDLSGAFDAMKATGEFAIGLSPAGWIYAALKLITAAPPAMIRHMVGWSCGVDIARYQKVRMERLPEDPLKFTTDEFRRWRGIARADFDDVWETVRPYAPTGHYDQAKGQIIRERLEKAGLGNFWSKYTSPLEHSRVRSEPVTPQEVADFVFTRWEAEVVVKVLSEYVPRRVQAAQREMLSTTAAVSARIVRPDGGPIGLAQGSGTIAGLSIKGNAVRYETSLGTLANAQTLRLRLALADGRGRLTVEMPKERIWDKARWSARRDYGYDYVSIDAGEIRVETGVRELKLNLTAPGVEEVRGPGLGASGAAAGDLSLELAPGTHLLRFSGKGPHGEPISRVTKITIAPDTPSTGAVQADLTPRIVVADAGALPAITSAIRANASVLRAGRIGAAEYDFAVGRSIAVAEGTVKQADGSEKSVRALALEEAAKTRDSLRQQVGAGPANELRALMERTRKISDMLPDEMRGSLASADNLAQTVARLFGDTRPRQGDPATAPTAAREWAIEYAGQQRKALEELLRFATGPLEAEVTSIRADAERIAEQYAANWAVQDHADRYAGAAVQSALSDGSLKRWEEIVRAAHEIADGPAPAEIGETIRELQAAREPRTRAVARAEAEHADLISALEGCRTVTLTDAARRAGALKDCPASLDLQRTILEAARIARALKPDDAALHRAAQGREFASQIAGAEAALADAALQEALLQLGAPEIPVAAAEARGVRAAKGALRLAAVASPAHQALAIARDRLGKYHPFITQNRSLLGDSLVDAALLRSITGAEPGAPLPRFRDNWFQGGSLAPAEAFNERVRYDTEPLREYVNQVATLIGAAAVPGEPFARAAGDIIEAIQAEQGEYRALQDGIAQTIAPYAQATRSPAGGDKALSAQLERCEQLSREMRQALWNLANGGLAPLHIVRMTEDSERAIADAHAGFGDIIRAYYARISANYETRARAIAALSDRLEGAWRSREQVEKYLFADALEEELTRIADMGAHNTGSPDLHWANQGTGASRSEASLIELVREADAHRDVALRNMLAAMDACRAAYREAFSFKARFSRRPPGVQVRPAEVTRQPALLRLRKAIATNPVDSLIAWSPDGQRLAWGVMIASIKSADLKGGPVVDFPQPEGWFGGSGTRPAFTPNGLLVVHEGPWGGGQTITSRMGAETATRIADRTAQIVTRLPDGSQMHVVTQLNATQAGVTGFSGLHVAPDGRIFLACHWADGVPGCAWLDPDTGELSRISLPGSAVSAELSADGQWIAYTEEATKKLFIAPAEGGSATDLGVIARDPTISPAGNWIAYCYGNEVRCIGRSGGAPFMLFATEGVSNLSWSPQGDAIAFRKFAEGDVGLWVAELR